MNEIELLVEGRTICDELRATAAEYGDFAAYSWRADTEWETLSWADTRRCVMDAAAAFVAAGLRPGDVVALMMPNRVEHVIADQGVVHAGGIPTTVYATLAADQIAYLATDCSARFAVLDGADQLSRWLPALERLPELRTVIVIDETAIEGVELPGVRFVGWTAFLAAASADDMAAAEARRQAVSPGDTLTLLYTSGTTGNPKGVVITHRMALYEGRVSAAANEQPEVTRGVSYLPFAHIADRVLSLYLPILRAGHIHFCPDPAQLAEVLRDARPHAFFGVPRVWEKMMAAIQAVLALERDEERKAAVAAAMEIGRRYVEAGQAGGTVSAELAEAFEVADREVLAPMRSLIGLGEARSTISAAAPLPLEVARFFAGLGMRILDVYGMTETTGAATANTPDCYKLGTVGRPLPGIEIRLAGDGEILVRGATCTPGYINLPEVSAELIDQAGWVHTGDVGRFDDDGFLTVVDRKKEIIITAGGENIAPSLLENLLKEHPLVGQALAFGDGRAYVVAVVTLDGEVAPAWAKANGIEAADAGELARHPRVVAEIDAAVAVANARLARVQQIKKCRILPAEWTAESEELTPTLKLRRRVIHGKYADVFDAMYGD